MTITQQHIPQQQTPGSLPILFYDGECGLCDRSVRWMLRHDPAGIFHFAPLQGQTARAHHVMMPPDRLEWSMILVDERGVHERSEAALRAVARLGGVWRAARILLIIPRPVRDWVYRLIARNRHRWWSPPSACPMPDSADRQRLLP